MPSAPELVGRVRHLALDQPDTLGDGDCERLRPGVLGQPTNTVTSLSFVATGGWLAARAWRQGPGRRGGALTYAAFTAVTGAGSVAYHGPQFPGAQLLHDTPILGVLGFGAAVPLWRRSRGRVAVPGWSPRLAATMAAGSVAAAAAYSAGRSSSRCCRPDSLLQLHGVWHLVTATLIGVWGSALWPEPDEPDEPADLDEGEPDDG